MIIYDKVEQHSEDWFKLKWGKIGGTRAKGLFVKSDTLLIELLAEITEPFEMDDSFSSPDMDRGTEMEPQARAALSGYTGVEFIQAGWLESSENILLGISPDGISPDGIIAAEIKCPARKKHLQTVMGDAIPLDYIHQCVHYFTINNKLQKLYFCSYRPEAMKPIFVKYLTRNSIVNLGTKSKPILKTVQEWTDLAKMEADKLVNQIKQSINKLNF